MFITGMGSTNYGKRLVYNSTDGISWNLVTDNANLPDNQWETGQYTAISYDNKMWMFIAGIGSTNYGKRLVYNSIDGISWNLVTDNANFPDNQWVTGQYTAISYDNKMWMFITGIGSTNYGKRLVYNSTDGISWNLVTDNANFPDNQWVTGQYTAISYHNKMWMFIAGIGSTNYGKRLVYNSTDGISWNLVTDNANLPDNQWVTGQYTAISYDNKMWMFITGIGSTNYGKRIVSTSGK
jgi:3',5'-cyclic AMP phosphodiesterase CpdA